MKSTLKCSSFTGPVGTVGPPGQNGVNGNNGTNGVNGPPGPQGPQGSPGGNPEVLTLIIPSDYSLAIILPGEPFPFDTIIPISVPFFLVSFENLQVTLIPGTYRFTIFIQILFTNQLFGTSGGAFGLYNHNTGSIWDPEVAIPPTPLNCPLILDYNIVVPEITTFSIVNQFSELRRVSCTLSFSALQGVLGFWNIQFISPSH